MTAPSGDAEGFHLVRGTRLGPYEVLAPLGSGGMGEVYRARDERLGREVAVKVLTADSSSDPERLRRFEQEARAVGALNHPNLLAVFDTGEEEGRPFVVFELLEGVTLRQRMGPGALAVGKALDYAIQIARGLAAAHERGIVHRDLKPENLFVTKDGRLKILDFGLAKLSDPAERDRKLEKAETRTATAPGLILGTVGYMSPEQVRGKPADARSDLFSLGTILYEMLSGRRAFEGATATDTLGAILTRDPPEITTSTGVLPAGLERVVRRCLEKDPEERLQSARDVAFALEALSGPRPGTELGVAVRRRRRRLLAGAALVAAAAAGLAAAAWLARRTPNLSPPRVVALTSLRGVEGWPTFSPDGEQVAFAWGGEKSDNLDIYLTMVGSPEVRRLTTDPAVELAPSWSPDGRQIAFLRGRFEGTPQYPWGYATIYLVSPLGGCERAADLVVARRSMAGRHAQPLHGPRARGRVPRPRAGRGASPPRPSEGGHHLRPRVLPGRAPAGVQALLRDLVLPRCRRPGRGLHAEGTTPPLDPAHLPAGDGPRLDARREVPGLRARIRALARPGRGGPPPRADRAGGRSPGGPPRDRRVP
jgi:hypothetical protein